jgi:hypothetical protein
MEKVGERDVRRMEKLGEKISMNKSHNWHGDSLNFHLQ